MHARGWVRRRAVRGVARLAAVVEQRRELRPRCVERLDLHGRELDRIVERGRRRRRLELELVHGRLPLLRLFLLHAVHARPRVHVVVDGPARALPLVRQQARNLDEAQVQQEVVLDRVLRRRESAVDGRGRGAICLPSSLQVLI
jgi:hypothetical protein